jgi:hypothetical protein
MGTKNRQEYWETDDAEPQKVSRKLSRSYRARFMPRCAMRARKIRGQKPPIECYNDR